MCVNGWFNCVKVDVCVFLCTSVYTCLDVKYVFLSVCLSTCVYKWEYIGILSISFSMSVFLWVSPYVYLSVHVSICSYVCDLSVFVIVLALMHICVSVYGRVLVNVLYIYICVSVPLYVFLPDFAFEDKLVSVNVSMHGCL